MKIDHLIADVVCIFIYFLILMWATWCWCWWWLWEIGKCLLSHTAPLPWPSPLTRVASLDTPPLSLSLAVGCAHWFPPSVGQHHFTPTGSLCGPGDRPNPPRPRSHQVTHIVRFATHPAQKSISELVRAPKRHFRPLKQQIPNINEWETNFLQLGHSQHKWMRNKFPPTGTWLVESVALSSLLLESEFKNVW